MFTHRVIQVQSESAEIIIVAASTGPGQPEALSLGGNDVAAVLQPDGLGGLRACNLKGGWLLCS